MKIPPRISKDISQRLNPWRIFPRISFHSLHKSKFYMGFFLCVCLLCGCAASSSLKTAETDGRWQAIRGSGVHEEAKYSQWNSRVVTEGQAGLIPRDAANATWWASFRTGAFVMVNETDFTINWISPDGEVYLNETFKQNIFNPNMQKRQLAIKNTPAADMPGMWQVEVYLKEHRIDQQSFQIVDKVHAVENPYKKALTNKDDSAAVKSSASNFTTSNEEKTYAAGRDLQAISDDSNSGGKLALSEPLSLAESEKLPAPISHQMLTNVYDFSSQSQKGRVILFFAGERADFVEPYYNVQFNDLLPIKFMQGAERYRVATVLLNPGEYRVRSFYSGWKNEAQNQYPSDAAPMNIEIHPRKTVCLFLTGMTATLSDDEIIRL